MIEPPDMPGESRDYLQSKTRHDLLTPLNAVIGFSGIVLEKAALDEKQKKNLQRVHDAGKRLLSMIQEIADASRVGEKAPSASTSLPAAVPSTTLASRHCLPFQAGAPPLEAARLNELVPQVPEWRVGDGKLTRTMTFKDFREGMAFLNRVAETAEAEGHHPDFSVHYNRVDFTLWTHAAGGLTENDFILAARIDALR